MTAYRSTQSHGFSWRVTAVLGLAAMLMGSVLMGHATAQSNAAPAAVVGMTNTLKFTPDTVRIRTGETVRWKNSSVIVHTVTADPEKATMKASVHLPEGADSFHSGTLDAKATYEHTFEVPGTYRYFCVPHEATEMYGTVIVEPKS